MKHLQLVALLVLCYAAYAKKDTTQNEKLKLAMDLVKYDFKTNKINHFSKRFGKKNIFYGYNNWHKNDILTIKKLLEYRSYIVFDDTIFVNNISSFNKTFKKDRYKILRKKKVLVEYTIPIKIHNILDYYGFIKVKTIKPVNEPIHYWEFCIYSYEYGEWVNVLCLNDMLL